MRNRGRLSRTRILCVNCNLCLNKLRRYPALELDISVTALLCTWTHPRIIVENDYVCGACRDLAMCRVNRALQQETSGRDDQQGGSNPKGHTNVCPICGCSILRRQSDIILTDKPSELQQLMINILESRLAPEQITVSDRVCHPCWLRTKREAIRLNGVDDTRSVRSSTNSAPEGSKQDDQPYGSSKSELNPIQGVAEYCADAGDSGPVEEPRVDNTESDICDDDHDDDDDGDDDSDTLVESNVCRVCLALDVKMYDLKDIELREMFQDITGIAVPESNHCILERLCWECAGRLKAAAAFRNKALLSDALLQRLADTGEQIRKNDITLIKEKEDYLKSSATLSVVEVFHTVEIDPENQSYIGSISKNNDKKIVHSTRNDSEKLKKSIIEENNDEMDVEDEPMIDAPIKTEIEYDPICNTDEENTNIVFETNPLFSNNIPLREDTINSAYSSPSPGCSHVEPKYPILGCLLKAPSDCENKTKKTVVKITNSISKTVPKKPKELISHDHTYLKCDAKFKNINVKVGGISKKTSNLKLVKKTQVKANTSTDEECLSLEDFEF